MWFAAAHARQPQLEPAGTVQERAAPRRQSDQDSHRGIVDLVDRRQIENAGAAIHRIE
jgi:hypothetical protein